MMTENIKALVAGRLEQADESLQASRTLLDAGLNRPSVNRAYYAMFYAVMAILARDKQETSKHSGAIALFDKNYVKQGIFTKDMSRWLHDAFDLRQRSDYAAGYHVADQDAAHLLKNSQSFVSEVKAFLAKEI